MADKDKAPTDRALDWTECLGIGCLLEWGIIHIIAGGVTAFYALLEGKLPQAVNFNCEAAPESVKQQLLDVPVSPLYTMTNRIVIQHGLDVVFIGICTTILAVFNAKSPTCRHAFYFTLFPWLCSLAYFIAIDTVEYGSQASEAQVFIASIGALCTAMSVAKRHRVGEAERIFTHAFPMLLFGAGVVNQLRKVY